MPEVVANGTFEVTLTPVTGADPRLSSLSLHKTFEGALSGTSVGQMLGIRTQQDGSAGYVAMEWVQATLDGRHGEFALQHTGTMDRGKLSSTISVIPDSGTDGLKGIAGTMSITVVDKVHHYSFRYMLD